MIMTDFSRWHIPPDDRSSGRRWRPWPSSSTCRPASKTKHCKSGKSEFILSELRCIDGVLNGHCGLKHWNEQPTVKPWVENEQNMEERDNIANSDWEIKRGCASLLDHEDHHDRRVGGGNVSIFCKFWIKKLSFFVFVNCPLLHRGPKMVLNPMPTQLMMTVMLPVMKMMALMSAVIIFLPDGFK